MTPQERAVIDAAKKWVGRIDPETNTGAWADEQDRALFDAVRALEPGLPEEPPVGSFVVDGDGDVWMRNEHAWNCLTDSPRGKDWQFINQRYRPLTRLVPASYVVDKELARRLADRLTICGDAADQALIAEVEAQIGGAA